MTALERFLRKASSFKPIQAKRYFISRSPLAVVSWALPVVSQLRLSTLTPMR